MGEQSIFLSKPQLGNPCMVQVVAGTDVLINTSFYSPAQLDVNSVQELIEGRVFLQQLEDTRTVFQRDDVREGLVDKTDEYVLATCDMNRWPDDIIKRLIELKIDRIEGPNAIALTTPCPDSTCANPGFLKLACKYCYKVTLKLPWADLRQKEIQLPQLFNLIQTWDLTDTTFSSNFRLTESVASPLAFNINFHSVYLHQRDWEDFAFLHVTDAHIAWRNDWIPTIVNAHSGGRLTAEKFVNWNDDFRDLIRYANAEHRQGRLDFIVITGDIVDYITMKERFRANVWRALDNDPVVMRRSFHDLSQREQDIASRKSNRAWGTVDPGTLNWDGNIWEPKDNFELFHDLITTFPRSADVKMGAELEVPLFTVLGNHDYRPWWYPLKADIYLGKIRVSTHTEFGKFNLTEAEADAYEAPGLALNTDDPILMTTPVEWSDLALARYRELINESPDYAIELGRHKIICLDSGHDAGLITTFSDYEWPQNKEQENFKAGSPDSEGFSPAQIARIGAEIRSASNGLRIIACHSPIINYKKSYPPDWWFRETIRIRSSKEEIQQGLTPLVGRGAPDPTDDPTFLFDPTPYFKIGNRDPWLGFSVIDKNFDEFMQTIIGQVQLVLTGHAHHSVEYIVRPRPQTECGGELPYEYYHDYYIDNTIGSTDLNANPADHPYRYSYPLNRSSNVDWWRDHSPLLVQTESLGASSKAAKERTFGLLIQVESGTIRQINRTRLEVHALPPFVERVALVRGSELTPPPFARMLREKRTRATSLLECPMRVYYDAQWEEDYGDRRLAFFSGSPPASHEPYEQGVPLRPDYTTYIIVTFGPPIYEKARIMSDETLSLLLRVKGFYTIPEGSFDQNVTLKRAYDAEVGDYYWGTFYPPNPWLHTSENPPSYDLHFEINGWSPGANDDLSPNYQIDSNPSTCALWFKESHEANAELINYEPGPDDNHFVMVRRLPQEKTLSNTSFDRATAMQLTLSQQDVNLPNTTLFHKEDMTYFLLDYTDFKDETNTDTTPQTSSHSFCDIVECPPKIEVTVGEDSGNCIIAQIFDYSDVYTHDLIVPKKSMVGSFTQFVFGPGEFSDHKLFIAVKNVQFDSQGPVRFTIQAVHHPMQFQMYGKPGFPKRALVTITVDPRPGPDDFINVLEKLERVAVQYIDQVTEPSSEQRTIALAEVRYTLGAFAQKWGLNDRAAQYLTASADAFKLVKQTDREVAVLLSLKNLYMVHKKTGKVGKIDTRINKIFHAP